MTSQTKIILRIFVLLLFIFALMYFGVLPFKEKMEKLSQEYLAQQEALIGLKQKASRLKELAEENQKAASSSLQFDKILISESNIVGFIETLEIAAKANRVGFNIQLVSNPQVALPVPNMVFQVSVTGTYDNIMRFIISLENMPFYLSIDSFQVRKLDSRDSNTKAGEVSASFSVIVFKN